MKLFLVAVLISMMCLPGFAYRGFGGDMPFPIGKIVDFPKDDGKGVWKDELKKKMFRLRPLKGVLDDGSILVQMLGLNKKVIAEGVGIINDNEVLNATLKYVTMNKYIEISIANLCEDATFDNNRDSSKSCQSTQMWAAMRIQAKVNQLFKATEPFVIKKTSED